MRNKRGLPVVNKRSLISGTLSVVATVTLLCGASSVNAEAAGAQSAGTAPVVSGGVPYNAATGKALVTQAKQLVAGQSPWPNGCTGKNCIPYSNGGGHGATPGPSYGKGKGADVFGIDCSGFTRWVYYLVYGTDVLGSVTSQEQTTRPGILQVAAGGQQPGDLVFLPGPPNHIGILVGMVNGDPRIAAETHTGSYAKVYTVTDPVGVSYWRFNILGGGFTVNSPAAGPIYISDTEVDLKGNFTANSYDPENEEFDGVPVSGKISDSGTINFHVGSESYATGEEYKLTGTATFDDSEVAMMSGTDCGESPGFACGPPVGGDTWTATIDAG